MYLRRFSIRNFMVHRDTTVDLFPITVLVGANNGGKSSFFDALLNFSMVSRGKLSTAFSPGPYSYEFRKHHGSAITSRIKYSALLSASESDEETLNYEIAYGKTGDHYVIFEEMLRDSEGGVLFDRAEPEQYPMGNVLHYLADDRSIFAAIRQSQIVGDYEESSTLITTIARDVSRISKYRLEPSNLARPSRLPDTPTDAGATSVGFIPRLSYRGEDLSTVLYYLSETRSDYFDRIVDHCKKIVGGFVGFEFNTVGTDRIGFSVKFADSRGTVPAANISDGTLVCIGLITLLTSHDSSPILCVEEPENGLTPPATRAIYEIMQEFAKGAHSGVPAQLLISSHSPYVICEAWNGDDRDFIYQMRPEEGSTVVRRFADIVAHHQIPLEKDTDNKRTRMNLRNAELITEGYLSS